MARSLLRLICCLVVVARPANAAPPASTSDVVKIALKRHSIADGLETYFLDITVENGWSLVVPVPKDEKVKPGLEVEFLTDGKPTTVVDIAAPLTVRVQDKSGKATQVYDGPLDCTAWLIWDETWKAKAVSVRATLTATDGTRTLPAAVVTVAAK